MIEHEGGRQNHGRGVGDALAGDIRRAAVHGFEHRTLVTNVGAGRQAQAADQPGTEIRQDIAEQIGGYDDVEILRLHHELHGTGIDDQLFVLEIIVLLGQLAAHFEKQPRGGFHDVGLVRQRHLLASARACHLEGELEDALALFTSNDRQGLGALAVLGHGLALTGIHAALVFTDSDDVEIVVARFRARQADGGPHVGIQIEMLAHGHVDRAIAAAGRRGHRAFQDQTGTLDRGQRVIG